MTGHDERYRVALAQALQGRDEGGVPIGGALFLDDTLLAEGRNRRVQENSPIMHAEIDVLRAAGRPMPSWKGELTLYTTMSPCLMCSGAAVLYRVHTVVIGESQTFDANEDLLRQHGINVVTLHDAETLDMFTRWAADHRELWAEDTQDPSRI